MESHLIDLGYSKQLKRNLIIVFKIETCTFCDCQQGVELLVKAEHKSCWLSYKSKDMVEAKGNLVKAIAKFKTNYNIG